MYLSLSRFHVMKELNLIGKKFNKLTPIEKTKRNGRVWYKCICDCGNETFVETWHLHSGKTKSCGCIRKETDKIRGIKNRKEYGLSNARRVVSYYKRNAKRRNIEFNLTEKECIVIMAQSCHYCGREPFNTIKAKQSYGEFVFNGIDRVDNTKYYTIDNVVSCCKNCNSMKKDLSNDEFIEIIKLIYNNLNK